MRMRIVSWGALCIGLGLVVGCSKPEGPDLVDVVCACVEGGQGGGPLTIDGRVCTDSAKPDKFKADMQSLCDSKETTCIPSCPAPIDKCAPYSYSVTPKGCPDNSSPLAGGDFGQARSIAAEGSHVDVHGDDIHSFTVVPDHMTVWTTQTGSELRFADVTATLPETKFTASGIFTDSDHTLSDARMFLVQPFSASLGPGGSFSVPSGQVTFIVSGLLDGDRTALSGTAESLSGHYDEAAATFDLTGSVHASDADITLDVSMTFTFVNRPPVANAGPDATFECNSTALTGPAHVSGAASTDPDGATDLQFFNWFFDFGTPAAKTVTGRDVDVDLGLGSHDANLYVNDASGSFSLDDATITIADRIPPHSEIIQPAAANYAHSATLTLGYTVKDVCTGVAGFTPSMDGATTLAGHGLASGQAINLLTEMTLGSHTFAIASQDNASNAQTESVTFTIIVTPQSLSDDVKQFMTTGKVAPPWGNTLLKTLANAGKAFGSDCGTAANVYNSFINDVQAQTGKKVDPAAAAILIGDAQYLITHCP